MKKLERQRKIQSLLKEHNDLSLVQLMEYTGVSEATIRRDLAQMEEQNMIQRLWGGASFKPEEKISSSINFGDDFLARYQINSDIKDKLAEYAASLIPDDAVIYVDPGTTLPRMFKYLTQKNLTIVTNSILSLDLLAQKNIKTYVAHGYVNFATAAILGSETATDILSLNFDMAFLGANAIDTDTGYTISDRFDYEVKLAAIKKAKKTYVVCDSSKFDKRQAYTFAQLDDDITLISDKKPDFKVKDVVII